MILAYVLFKHWKGLNFSHSLSRKKHAFAFNANDYEVITTNNRPIQLFHWHSETDISFCSVYITREVLGDDELTRDSRSASKQQRK